MVSQEYALRISERAMFEQKKGMTIKEMIDSGVEVSEFLLWPKEMIPYNDKKALRKEVKDRAWDEAYGEEDTINQEQEEEDEEDEEDKNLTYSQRQVKAIHSFHN